MRVGRQQDFQVPTRDVEEGSPMMNSANQNPVVQLPNGTKLKMLSIEQLRQIDELLSSVGEYGEVHLVIQHGELRYINRLESHKAWKNNSSNGRVS